MLLPGGKKDQYLRNDDGRKDHKMERKKDNAMQCISNLHRTTTVII